VGSSSGDMLGRHFPPLFGVHFSGLIALPDGGLLIRSSMWSRAGAISAGAITYVAPGQSPAGVLTTSNSLLGASFGESLGFGREGPLLLPGGGVMVSSPGWDGPAGPNQGAVIRFDDPADLRGEITAERALIGAQAEDQVGSGSLTLLPNGAVLVASPSWRSGGLAQAGALTWIAPGASMAGETVGVGNSLIGTQANDRVSSLGVKVLANGNAVIASPFWANGDQTSAGAVTWIDAETGLTGAVSPANSLVGSIASSLVGSLGGDGSSSGVVALANGHYLVRSPAWRATSEVADVGAVTWGDGASGRIGVVDSANSLVGQRTADRVGLGNVRELADGHALVHTPSLNSPSGFSVGAVTWLSGSGATSGVLDAQNSWIGSNHGDLSGVGMHAFDDGSALVTAFTWGGNAGAVFRIPAGGGAGVVGPDNSQVGQPGDRLGAGLGQGRVVALGDGSVLVSSPSRSVMGQEQAGSLHRVAFGESPVGNLLDADAFTGVRSFDQFGGAPIGVMAAAQGEGFFAVSADLSNPAGNSGHGGLTATRSSDVAGQVVSVSNTLFGEAAQDFQGVQLLPQGRGTYLLHLPGWDSQGVQDAGRLIWFDSTAVPGNGLNINSGRLGVVANDFRDRQNSVQIDWENEHIIIGLPLSNRVIFVPLSSGTLFANGFEGD
jgi:hypothetical protein